MLSQYKYGDMVFAKCQHYPYWPGKILTVLPNQNYKVLFYGEKSEATIHQSSIIPFNQQTYRKFAAESNKKNNAPLKFSLSVALKHHNKRKKGLNSTSEDQEIYQESQPKKEQIYRKTNKPAPLLLPPTPKPTDPYQQLNQLLNSLSNQASSSTITPVRTFTPQQHSRLTILLDPSQTQLQLPQLIDSRVLDRFIVTLKQLDLWGLKDYEQINQLHGMLRKRYQQWKSIILGGQFASIRIKQSNLKRQRIIQKVLLNKAVL